MSYRIKEVFRSLQGEGYWTGTPAVFVRLAGCNLWSGREGHRARDVAKSRARCPAWCDTDFLEGERLEAEQVAARVVELADGIQHVVFTGGEPLLQLDAELLEAVDDGLPDATLALETNGTLELPFVGGFDWVSLSPKRPFSELRLRKADELKVVFPAYDPLEYEEVECRHRFVQPEAPSSGPPFGEVLDWAVAFCLKHPDWRLSLQIHKWLEVP